MQEIGESREQWGQNVWAQAEDIASTMKSESEPFYIVYAAKQDRKLEGTFRQAFRIYRQRPPKIIGLLVWYVDNMKGSFDFIPELSIPPDVPLDESLLSTDRSDSSERIMEVGQRMGVLLS